ncbi:MAG: DPP IV N-terminal domain-containing protein, partial [bacterium]|nr:DPP IV N-terminal domain-containing protein [bacterium]
MKQKTSLLLVLILCLISLLNSSPALAQNSDELTIEWINSQESRKVTALPAIAWLEDGSLIIYDSSKKQTLGKEKAPRSISFPLAFNARGEQGVYDLDGDIFILDIKTARFKQVTATDPEEKCINFSPDGTMLAYVRDNDLYIYHLENGIETRLTTDGSDTILNGTLSWVYWEEVFGRQDIAYWWSDDSKAIAFLQTDDSPVS